MKQQGKDLVIIMTHICKASRHNHLIYKLYICAHIPIPVQSFEVKAAAVSKYYVKRGRIDLIMRGRKKLWTNAHAHKTIRSRDAIIKHVHACMVASSLVPLFSCESRIPDQFTFGFLL